jgi:glucans biosynthesis protein C
MPTAEDSSRLVFLDWLRIGAFGLLVLFHVGMYYVSWGWHVKSPHASAAIEPWMLLSSPWRLTLLFFVSGAATGLMLRRREATAAWLGSRTRKLGLPLLFGVFVVVPPQSYFEVVHKWRYAGDYIDFLRLYLTAFRGFCGDRGACLILPTWNHLWFVAYLLAYTVVVWLMLRLWPRMLTALAPKAEWLLAGARIVVLPVLVFVLLRLTLRDRFPPTFALVGDWFNHAQYGLVYIGGAVLAHAPRLWRRLHDARWPALLLAILGWVVLVALQPAGAAAPPAQLARGLATSTVQWCAIVAAVGFAQRWLTHDGALRRYLTQAVFPIYILHQTVIIVLAEWLGPLALTPSIEAALLIVLTFALSFLGFEIARHIGWLRPWLGIERRVAPGAAPRLTPVSNDACPRAAHRSPTEHTQRETP